MRITGVHHRHDEVFGHVHDLVQIDAVIDAHAVDHRDEHFQRRVAGAGAEARHRAVDAVGTRLDRGQRVRDAHRHVVVTVEAELGFGLELAAHAARCAPSRRPGSM
jgi:hypothetical protein